jgi:hypothetical protein
MTYKDVILLAKKIGVGILVFLVPLLIFFFALLIVQAVLN